MTTLICKVLRLVNYLNNRLNKYSCVTLIRFKIFTVYNDNVMSNLDYFSHDQTC